MKYCGITDRIIGEMRQLDEIYSDEGVESSIASYLCKGDKIL